MPSEIVESFRNLGRFPSGHAPSFRRRLPPNQLFLQGETRGEALAAGGGPALAHSYGDEEFAG